MVTPEFTRVFGQVPELEDKSLFVSNVDGLFENLMESDGTVWVMDYEWVFAFPIPLGFLKYRNLYYFYERFKEAFGWDSLSDFLRIFDIGEELFAIYRSMEEAFQSYVHGDSSQGYLKAYQQTITSFETLKDEEGALFKTRDWVTLLQTEIEEKTQQIEKRS